MNKEEIKFDHFESIDDLIKTIYSWCDEDEQYYSRWFGLNDMYVMAKHIENTQSQLSQANNKIEKIKEYLNSGNVDDSIAIETINKIINKENL